MEAVIEKSGCDVMVGNAPLISIIVPTMNSATLIRGALESLAEQQFRDFEVVISDGASGDETVVEVHRFINVLPSIVVDSRPDRGVYDAINRGVRMARGEWFYVLGADDRLHAPGTLTEVAEQLQSCGGAELVYGDVRMMADSLTGVPAGGRYAGPMPLNRLFKTNICQQAIFYRRTLFDTLGGFNERFRLHADWDFNLRAAFRSQYRWIDMIVADYAATGMSATVIDELFRDELPGLIQRELERCHHERRMWPFQKHLLREADRLRRRGRWSGAWATLRAYVRLLFLRVPVLMSLKVGSFRDGKVMN